MTALAQDSLIDLLAPKPTKVAALRYDAIAFAPTIIKRLKKAPKSVQDWAFDFSTVDDRLDFRPFASRLVDVAKLRGFA